MALEATILILDNSEWVRSGDFAPNRMEAQKDAATLIFDSSIRANGENAVGLMTMAGKSPKVLVSLTQDIRKVLVNLHKIRISGDSNFNSSVQIAQLALKHRQNKNHKQRIVLFVGSPLVVDEKILIKIAQRLKKNNVAIDIVNFGESKTNTSILQQFIEAANNNNNSHLLTADPSVITLRDFVASSQIFFDWPPAGGTAENGFEFGVDPNLDPELALALRLSIEEERIRQEPESAPMETTTNTENNFQEGSGNVQDATAPSEMSIDNDMNADEQMRRAIELSLLDQGGKTDDSSSNAEEQNKDNSGTS